MDKKIIAAQLYTLRDHLKTPAEIAATLKRVKKIGFDAVQVSGLGPIEPAELKKILDGEGLVCCATHESGKDIVEETGKVAEKLKTLGCVHTAYPYPHTRPDTAKGWAELAGQLDAAGRKLRESGLVLSYHNHAIEFQKYDGRTALEIIYAESDPKNLKGEIDTYWVQYGGGNPVAWCEKLKGRLPLLHLKEYGILNAEVKMMEVGSGNLDWNAVVKAARKSGTEWFIIEQDTCLRDPFDSLESSLKYLIEEI